MLSMFNRSLLLLLVLLFSMLHSFVCMFISSLLSITCSTCPPLSRLLQTAVKCIKSERSWNGRKRTEVGNEKQRDKEVSCDLKIILNEKSGNKDNAQHTRTLNAIHAAQKMPNPCVPACHRNSERKIDINVFAKC